MLREFALRSDFQIGPLSVSPSRRLVSGPSGQAHLEPLIMQVFLLLADADGSVVTREDLFDRCWGGVVVGDDSLNRAVAKVRRVASELAPGAFEIETIPRTGYRLSATIAGGTPTIAVLPFSNLSSDPDQEYFVAGMVDEIVTALTRVRALLVISAESSWALKGKDLDDREAAARMGVRYVLKGSVRRSGSQIRIAAKLVDTSRGVQIWAERFDYKLKDVFELQDRIALEVAAVIEPSVHEAEVRRVARQPLENLGCYDLYLRAAPLRATCRKEEVLQALLLLDRALALDADFAPALAQKAGCHSQVYANGWDEDRESHRTQGIILADRALMNGGEDASVLAQVGNALMDLEGNIPRAAALAERAIAINPGCARAWFISGMAQLYLCNGDIAVEHLETAARLDPISSLNDVALAHIGVGLAQQGDYPGALSAIRATTHRTARIHLTLASVYGYLSMPKESLEEIALFDRQSSLSAEDLIATTMPVAKAKDFLLDGIRLGREGARSH